MGLRKKNFNMVVKIQVLGGWGHTKPYIGRGELPKGVA